MGKILEAVKNNKKMVIIISAVVVVVAIAGIFILGNKAENLTAYDIFAAMKEDKDIKEMIADDIEIKDIDDDPVALIGSRNSYTSKVKFADVSDTRASDEDKYPSGAIEVFNNEKDLSIRVKQFEYANEALEKAFPSEEYGHVLKLVSSAFDEIVMLKNGNALLLLSGELEDAVIKKYQKAFDKVLEDKTYDQVDIPKKDAIDELVNNYKKDLDKNIIDVNLELDSALEEVYKAVDESIEASAQSQSETDLASTKDLVSLFNANHYQEKYSNWQAKIADIEKQIADQKAAAEAEAAAKKAAAEAEKKRQEELANNKHNPGMYKVGTDIQAGEYVLIGSGYFSINNDSTGSLSSIISNDNFKNNSIVSVSDGQYLTVKNAVFYDINLNPEVSTSGEGMFKVGLHIPAGEYKLVSTGSTSGYCAVLSSSSHTMGTIVSNDNFTGEKYITVKNGQYLKLNRCKINQ